MNWTAALRRIWVPRPGHRIAALSDEWWTARRGRLTASSRARSIAGPRAVGNFPKLKEKILDELDPNYERTPQGKFAATDWGNENERRALSVLEMRLGLDEGESYEPGFLLHPSRSYAGGTPDLIIETPAGECVPAFRTAVQVKCPFDQSIHQKTLRTGKIADDTYRYQLQWEGWITGATQLMFVSYDPRQRRGDQQLAMIDVPVDFALRKIFEQRCDQFRAYMDTGVVPASRVGLDELAAAF